MTITVFYPFPENAPKGVQPVLATNVNGTIPAALGTTSIPGFIPGREYTLVITGFNGHVGELHVPDAVTGEVAVVPLSEATANWTDVIMMPTTSLEVEITTAGTGDLNLNAVLVAT